MADERNSGEYLGGHVRQHRYGDLICPEVQAGSVSCQPRWLKFKDHYTNVNGTTHMLRNPEMVNW